MANYLLGSESSPMASNAICSPPRIKHDVFINFRGKDTRNNFISHLRSALRRNGIDAFTDKGLKGGEEIPPTLFNNISESQISIVVFSPNYADSRWCLDELVKIMECKTSHGQAVLPVFLQGVEPTHVRNLQDDGPFADGFRRLIQKAQYADKVDSWLLALKQAANLSGWDSKETSEGKIVEKLLNRVQSVLGQLCSDDSGMQFIGIERVEEVESLLSLPGVRCLGIWGMGGSGKTMLVRKIHESISSNFDACCLIENVREFAEKHQLNLLRRHLLSQLLRKDDDLNQGPTPLFFQDSIQRELRRKKVLVILDDISDASQLQELIGNLSFYGPGSKMIAVSRDHQVLKNECNRVYQVRKLNNRQSLQLLKLHILKQRQPTSDQSELMKEAVEYTQGLPLALVVLGRNLFDKDIAIWKSELAKLGDVPDLQIMKILMTSFDGLDDTTKSIFLDIACLMKGWNKDRVESILDACGYYAASRIARLVDKALITISYHRIWMHDLLQQMGQKIAWREGRPSRLWKSKEITDLLSKDQEEEWTKGIEVISLDLSTSADIELRPRVFEKMKGLRILRFHNPVTRNYNRISLPEGLKYLPDRLRYLEWDLYPARSLPPQFNPYNLVELRMTNSNLAQLWTSEAEPCLPSLKLVNLRCSNKLTTLPNLRNAFKLETLWLSCCENLEDVPDSIQHLVELKDIRMDGNSSLSRFPEFSHLTNLETLKLQGCSKITSLPRLPPNLIDLNLSYTNIKVLPPSIQQSSQLQFLRLDGCEELDLYETPELSSTLQMHITEGNPLKKLPASIYGLSSLTELWCAGYKGDALPSLKSLVSLTVLYVQGSNLKGLPKDIKYLTNLWSIEVNDCKSLSYIPELPPSIKYFDACNCISLQKYTPRSLEEDDDRLLSLLDFKGFGTGLDGHHLHMRFNDCFNLEKDARNKIWSDFWQRVRFIINPVLDMMYDEYWGPDQQERFISRVTVPGNEVPEWLKYSKIGSSLQVNINRRRRLHPLGFIFCVVVGPMPDFDGCERTLTIRSEGLTRSGQSFSSYCPCRTITYQTEHTILWCERSGNSQIYFDGGTFEFSAEMYIRDSDTGGMVLLDDPEVVKCGVTPISSKFGTKWLPVIKDDNFIESLVKRSEKRKRGSDEEGEPTSHRRSKKGRDHSVLAIHFPIRRALILQLGNKACVQRRRRRRGRRDL